MTAHNFMTEEHLPQDSSNQSINAFVFTVCFGARTCLGCEGGPAPLQRPPGGIPARTGMRLGVRVPWQPPARTPGFPRCLQVSPSTCRRWQLGGQLGGNSSSRTKDSERKVPRNLLHQARTR